MAKEVNLSAYIQAVALSPCDSNVLGCVIYSGVFWGNQVRFICNSVNMAVSVDSSFIF